MMKRMCVPILVAALLMLSALPTFAQDATYCSELSDDDCQLLYDAADAAKEVLSASSVSNVNVVAQNLPQVPYSDLTFDLVVESTSSSSQEAVNAALNIDPAMANDPEMFADVMGEIFGGIALDTSMDVSFSSDLVDLIETEGNLAWPENVVLNLRLVDGDGFVDFDALKESVPELDAMLPAELSGWVGAEVSQLVQNALMDSAGDPNMQASLNGATMGSQSGGPLLTQLAPLDPTGDALQFLIVERGEDVSADGEDAASFVYTFDLTSFVGSDLYATLVEAIMAQQDGAMPSEQEVTEIVGVSRLVAPLLANSLELELTETIGLDSANHYGSDFLLSLDLTELVGVASSFGAIPPLDIEGDSLIELAVTTSSFDINEDVEIETPEDAGVYTAEQLQQMIEMADSLQ